MTGIDHGAKTILQTLLLWPASAPAAESLPSTCLYGIRTTIERIHMELGDDREMHPRNGVYIVKKPGSPRPHKLSCKESIQ